MTVLPVLRSVKTLPACSGAKKSTDRTAKQTVKSNILVTALNPFETTQPEAEELLKKRNIIYPQYKY
jgi:hypothetical protein